MLLIQSEPKCFSVESDCACDVLDLVTHAPETKNQRRWLLLRRNRPLRRWRCRCCICHNEELRAVCELSQLERLPNVAGDQQSAVWSNRNAVAAFSPVLA